MNLLPNKNFKKKSLKNLVFPNKVSIFAMLKQLKNNKNMNNKLITFWTALYLLGEYVTIVGTFFLVWAIYDHRFDFNIFYVTSLGFFLAIDSWKILQDEKRQEKSNQKFGFSK